MVLLLILGGKSEKEGQLYWENLISSEDVAVERRSLKPIKGCDGNHGRISTRVVATGNVS